MALARRSFHDVSQLPLVNDLMRSASLSCRHVIDLPWRLCSPAIHEGRDAVHWQDDAGQIVGFAAWQLYWATLDFYILPGPHAQAVEDDLFAWADQRFRERDAERGYSLPYSVEYRDDDTERRRLVQSHGYTLDEAPYYVAFERSLSDLPPIPTLPDGFTVRPLEGAGEAEAYAQLHRAAFETDSMTAEWRARTLLAPQYRPDLDLVVVAPDGSLAAFSVGWLDSEREVAQIEPLGVHPRWQSSGLARVLMLELFHRFKAAGAPTALVETDLDRGPARRAYESMGFQQTHTIYRAEKRV